MAIGSAVAKGETIYVYDEKGKQLFIKTGELMGYTGSIVTVKRSGHVYTYDEKGSQKSVKSV